MIVKKTLLALLTLSSFLAVSQPSAQPAPSGPPAAPPSAAPSAPPSGPPGGSAPPGGVAQPAAGTPPAPGSAPPEKKSSQILAPQRTGLVCSIFVGNLSLAALGIRLTQYSTLGLVQDCDEDHFNRLTTTSIEAQFRAVQQPLFVIRGGAHRYLMDVNLATLPKPFVRVGNLMLSPVGFIDINLRDLLANKGLQQGSVVASEYKPFKLTSNIHYIWNIGQPVHRLVTPEGDRYVMFGYTKRVIENVNTNNLALIGPLLNPPVGWKYESYLLDRTLTIKAEPRNSFTLQIVFDDAYNMYVQTDD